MEEGCECGVVGCEMVVGWVSKFRVWRGVRRGVLMRGRVCCWYEIGVRMVVIEDRRWVLMIRGGLVEIEVWEWRRLDDRL